MSFSLPESYIWKYVFYVLMEKARLLHVHLEVSQGFAGAFRPGGDPGL